MGTWIEINDTISRDKALTLSFPYWERGLKYEKCKQIGGKEIVVPLLGTWIEIEFANNHIGRLAGRSLIGNVD